MPYFTSHLSSSHSAASSSRPSSRASSPTRSHPIRAPIPANISIPPASAFANPSTHRSNTYDSVATTSSSSISGDPISDFYTPHTPHSYGHSTHSGHSTPAYGSYGPADMGMSGAQTPGGAYFPPGPHGPVEIVLDSEHLVMRGQGGDMNPAYLSGRLELDLHESTNIREINMHLTCKAKVAFVDNIGASSKNHHFTHTLMSHDWSFLEGDKRHTHTLKAGHHSFPFSLLLDGSLPSSIQTYTSDGVITYKLRAVVVRAGFTATNYHATKMFTLDRTFTSDALEFNQTLEIENTWPGKVMYSLTLPYKAYAAGDEIPVNVKFMPLAKGVRVTSVTSVIKEYSLVHTRHSSHPESRVAASVKHELRDGRAYLIAEEPVRPPLHYVASAHGSRQHSSHASRPGSPTGRGRPADWRGPRPEDSYFPGPSAEAGPSQPTAEMGDQELAENLEVGDDEVNTALRIPVPAFTTPSHSIHPIFVTHKIKWSCSISNPDGHVSELRCALPITILEHRQLDEARAAGASTRGLLFGGSAAEQVGQIDLPSYSNHVYDRIAVADSTAATGVVSRSMQNTPLPSPHEQTPPGTRPVSRPSSPHGSRNSISDQNTPADELPPRRELDRWADSELLLSLGALQVHSQGSSPSASGSGTPAISRGPSRPLSRRNSRSGRNSRAGSRASSPERAPAAASSSSSSYHSTSRSTTGSGLGSLLHLPAGFKAMKPLTGHHTSTSKPILRNSSAANLAGMHSANTSVEALPRGSVAFGNVPERGSGRVAFAGNDHPEAGVPRRASGVCDMPGEAGGGSGSGRDALSQVPSYDIASRGFLGGGVVPLDEGLPTYDVSERLMRRAPGLGDGAIQRVRSDTALVALGAAEAARAEERAEGQA